MQKAGSIGAPGKRPDPVVEIPGVDRVDEPDAAVARERVRGAGDRLVGERPAEADLDLVADPRAHASRAFR